MPVDYNPNVSYNFKYNDLQDLVTGRTYNRGELKIGLFGGLSVINNHAIFSILNCRTTTDAENARTRSAVFNVLAQRVQELKDTRTPTEAVKARLDNYLSNAYTLLFDDGTAKLSLSRSEANVLVMLLESVADNITDEEKVAKYINMTVPVFQGVSDTRLTGKIHEFDRQLENAGNIEEIYRDLFEITGTEEQGKGKLEVTFNKLFDIIAMNRSKVTKGGIYNKIRNNTWIPEVINQNNQSIAGKILKVHISHSLHEKSTTLEPGTDLEQSVIDNFDKKKKQLFINLLNAASNNSEGKNLLEDIELLLKYNIDALECNTDDMQDNVEINTEKIKKNITSLATFIRVNSRKFNAVWHKNPASVLRQLCQSSNMDFINELKNANGASGGISHAVFKCIEEPNRKADNLVYTLSKDFFSSSKTASLLAPKDIMAVCETFARHFVMGPSFKNQNFEKLLTNMLGYLEQRCQFLTDEVKEPKFSHLQPYAEKLKQQFIQDFCRYLETTSEDKLLNAIKEEDKYITENYTLFEVPGLYAMNTMTKLYTLCDELEPLLKTINLSPQKCEDLQRNCLYNFKHSLFMGDNDNTNLHELEYRFGLLKGLIESDKKELVTDTIATDILNGNFKAIENNDSLRETFIEQMPQAIMRGFLFLEQNSPQKPHKQLASDYVVNTEDLFSLKEVKECLKARIEADIQQESNNGHKIPSLLPRYFNENFRDVISRILTNYHPTLLKDLLETGINPLDLEEINVGFHISEIIVNLLKLNDKELSTLELSKQKIKEQINYAVATGNKQGTFLEKLCSIKLPEGILPHNIKNAPLKLGQIWSNATEETIIEEKNENNFNDLLTDMYKMLCRKMPLEFYRYLISLPDSDERKKMDRIFAMPLNAIISITQNNDLKELIDKMSDVTYTVNDSTQNGSDEDDNDGYNPLSLIELNKINTKINSKETTPEEQVELNRIRILNDLKIKKHKATFVDNRIRELSKFVSKGIDTNDGDFIVKFLKQQIANVFDPTKSVDLNKVEKDFAAILTDKIKAYFENYLEIGNNYNVFLENNHLTIFGVTPLTNNIIHLPEMPQLDLANTENNKETFQQKCQQKIMKRMDVIKDIGQKMNTPDDAPTRKIIQQMVAYFNGNMNVFNETLIKRLENEISGRLRSFNDEKKQWLEDLRGANKVEKMKKLLEKVAATSYDMFVSLQPENSNLQKVANMSHDMFVSLQPENSNPESEQLDSLQNGDKQLQKANLSLEDIESLEDAFTSALLDSDEKMAEEIRNVFKSQEWKEEVNNYMYYWYEMDRYLEEKSFMIASMKSMINAWTILSRGTGLVINVNPK